MEQGENSECELSDFSQRTIPLILDGTFFKILENEKEKVQAECTKCKRRIKGRIGSTTNFLNHLKVSNFSSIIVIINMYV